MLNTCTDRCLGPKMNEMYECTLRNSIETLKYGKHAPWTFDGLADTLT